MRYDVNAIHRSKCDEFHECHIENACFTHSISEEHIDNDESPRVTFTLPTDSTIDQTHYVEPSTVGSPGPK